MNEVLILVGFVAYLLLLIFMFGLRGPNDVKRCSNTRDFSNIQCEGVKGHWGMHYAYIVVRGYPLRTTWN